MTAPTCRAPEPASGLDASSAEAGRAYLPGAARRDRTGEPVEDDDRTPADVAALGAAACRASLAAARARREQQAREVSA